MIFTTEAETEARTRIARAMATGALSEEAGCRQILESDPDDVPALRYFADSALETRDFAGAERFARRMIHAHPLGHEGYLLLCTVLTEAGAAARGVGYGQA